MTRSSLAARPGARFFQPLRGVLSAGTWLVAGFWGLRLKGEEGHYIKLMVGELRRHEGAVGGRKQEAAGRCCCRCR